MKRIFKSILILLLLFISNNVYAADYTYRTNKENRIKVNVNGYDLYMSVSVIYNINNEAMGERMPLESFSAEYKDDTFYVSVKRSELNKAFKGKTYDNVYALFEIAADFVDFKEDKKYFYIDQHSPESPVGEEYYLTLQTEDFFYRNYGIMEVENTAAELIGTANQAVGSKRGGFVLYETDSLPERKKSYRRGIQG